MRIAFISKYPPIEGGVSSQTYWLAKGLGKKGVKVDIITNCWEVEEKYKINLATEDLKEFMPKNVQVFATDPFEKLAHIPYTNPDVAKLANIAVEVIKENGSDLIDSWYLLPYGIAAYIAHTITNKPFILRHAGSDLTKLLDSPSLNRLFREIILRARFIYTIPTAIEKFLQMGVKKERLVFPIGGSVDLNVFNPRVKPFDLSPYIRHHRNLPVITYLGKLNKYKGIFELIDAAAALKNEQFRLLLITKDDEDGTLKSYLRKKKILDKTILLDFVPPWKVSRIMAASNCIVLAEHDFPVGIHNPRIIREAMSCGKCVLVSKEICKNWPYYDLRDGKEIIKFDPKDPTEFRNKLALILKQPQLTKNIGRNARKFSEKIENSDVYIASTQKIYREIIKEK